MRASDAVAQNISVSVNSRMATFLELATFMDTWLVMPDYRVPIQAMNFIIRPPPLPPDRKSENVPSERQLQRERVGGGIQGLIRNCHSCNLNGEAVACQ
jgi:hypothetical protein